MSGKHRTAVAVLTGLLIGALFFGSVGSALAFGLSGGSAAQRNMVVQVVRACDWDYHNLPNVRITLKSMSYYPGHTSPGVIEVSTALSTARLRETTAHEWSHQVWYQLTPNEHGAWYRLVGVGGDDWWHNPDELFAECVRVTLWPDNLGGSYPIRSSMAAPNETQVLAFLASVGITP